MSGAITEAFDAKLSGQPSKLTPDDILRLHPVPVPTLSHEGSDPLLVPSLDEIRYYLSDFAASPDRLNAKYDKARNKAEQKKRNYDFRFTDAEKQRLQQHGFMVSERLGAESFAEIYYRLYTNDMPVFVTSDSVLHAWHRSFDAFLVDFETQELMPLLNRILAETLAALALAYGAAGSEKSREELQAVLGDVELYLAVAHRLLLGEPLTANEVASAPHSENALDSIFMDPIDTSGTDIVGEPVPLHVASNANHLTALLDLVHEEQPFLSIDIFGSPRDVDFSLFKPRGHYTKTPNLQRFFRAMAWLGTIDFRLDGHSEYDENAQASERYQLQCACVLVHVLREAGVLSLVQTLHDTVTSIAGDGVGADSMTPMQLHWLLESGECDILNAFFGPESKANLVALQREMAKHRLGTQAIIGHPMDIDPCSRQPVRSPAAFAFVGQQFVWSSFLFSKLVFDQVIDSETGAKVPRRMASAVDAAFALLRNNVAGIEIAARMKAAPANHKRTTQAGSEEFVAFRDGLSYTPSLLAARELVDEELEKAAADPGSSSLALMWQLALRELSASSANGDRVFQSSAWQKRQMNAQIASFAQLRHDTALYAKQGRTRRLKCEYPAGFVDPYPSFWIRMQQLAERAVTIISALKRVSQSGTDVEEKPVQRQGRACFENFGVVCGKLAAIAQTQAANTSLTDEQSTFLKDVMEHQRGSGTYRYLGWYPSLFYTNREDSGQQEHLVTDVHTDAPCDEHGDPGGILHLGVGDVNFGVFVVDGVMYAGPVFSQYEFVTPINERLTDEEFSARLGELAAPRWASDSFLVAE